MVVDGRVKITMEKCGDGVELERFPSAQQGARDDAANRVHPRYGCECFMIVDTLFRSVALDDQSRLARSVGLGLKDPFIADHILPGRNVFTQELFLGSMLE